MSLRTGLLEKHDGQEALRGFEEVVRMEPQKGEWYEPAWCEAACCDAAITRSRFLVNCNASQGFQGFKTDSQAPLQAAAI